MNTFTIRDVANALDASKYPRLVEVLKQRWKYSHYIHGAVAWNHGIAQGRPVAECCSVGVALEIAWAAILLLDDILDEDEVRFHVPAAWKEYGVGPVSMEAAGALAHATLMLSEYPEVLKDFVLAIEETEWVSRELRRQTYHSTITTVEPLIRKLGSMSVFATTWACHEKSMRLIAEFETCAGQLINDCNDCFGKKAMRRNFPDLRTHQPTLFSQLMLDNVPDAERWRRRFELATSDNRGLALLAQEVKIFLRQDSRWLFRYFDGCFSRANEVVQGLDERVMGVDVTSRLAGNQNRWRSKLKMLVES